MPSVETERSFSGMAATMGRKGIQCRGSGPQRVMALQIAGEIPQLGQVQVRDGPIAHARTPPADQVVSADARLSVIAAARVGLRPEEDVDGMLAALIDQRGHAVPADVIEPAPD